jgi:hypothetical protein
MSMEPLAYAGAKAPRRGPETGLGLKGLAWIGGAFATVAAVGLAAVLALFFAATIVVIGFLAAGLVAAGSLAYRARRALRRRDDDGVIEARHIGGHSWVAYGWDQRGR